MAENDLIVICKNCNQEIHYLREPEKGMGYIECPKCKCSIDQEGTVFVKPAVVPEVQKEIDILTEEHKQLHATFALEDLDNYYEFQKYYDRHEALIKSLESLNTYHSSCEDFIDDYRKFETQELKSDITDINQVIDELKSFKLKDPFIYLSKSGSIIINSTKEEFNSSSILKVAVYKALRMMPRNMWGSFKFLSSEEDKIIDQSICELGCSRVDNLNKSSKPFMNLHGEVLKQAQLSFELNKIELNKFFLPIYQEQYIAKDAKLISSDFVNKDFPLYVRKHISGTECQIHKNTTEVIIYSQNGNIINDKFAQVLKDISELKTSNIILSAVIERQDKETVCHIYDILYCEKDTHELNFSFRKEMLDLLGVKKTSFEPVFDGCSLNKTPYIICKKKEELEKAIERISKIKNYSGVVINTDSKFSLKSQELGIFTYSTDVTKNVISKQCGSQANYETAMICDFLNCEIKDIYINIGRASGVEAGNIFNAIQELTKNFTLVETRNFGSGEVPPIYQEIKLKKSLSKVFLIEGTRFYYDNTKNMPFILQVFPIWGGYQLKFISHINDQEINNDLKKHIAIYAKEYNFLKNEKFSVSGEFIDAQTIEWGDLKLEAPVKDKLKKLESLIAKNDPSIDSRGLIFVGPPGCGKTLTGKLLSKMSPTFIWVTAKDCSNMGPSYAFSTAFELARDLRPTILFAEDIDSYIGGDLVDLLKTELDGMKLNNGVFTILTSNFPEHLPEALIDRPGRFHDIIEFKLPDEMIRKDMLQHFLKEEVSEPTLDSIVKQTEGFSGAHIREICRFAKIIQKEDGLDLNVALSKSLEKLLEQRKLIQDLRNKN